MKFGEIFRFEVEYQLRRTSTPVFAVLLGVLALHMNQQLAAGPRAVNSPMTVMSAAALVGMFGMLVTAVLFADAATRDVSSRMQAIIYTAPISRFDYLGGRFLGALAVNVALVLFVPFGLILAALIPSFAGPETYLPFQIEAYVQPLLLITLPNLVITAASLFTVAALTRRALPGYVIALVLALGFVLSLEQSFGLSGALGATLMDPFGIAAIRDHARYWTPAERNVTLVGVPDRLLANRAVWLSAAFALLAFLHSRFRFALPGGESGSWRLSAAEDDRAELSSIATTVRAERRSGARRAMDQTIAIAGNALHDILYSRLFLAISIGALGVVFLTAENNGAAVFDTTVYPVTHLVATSMLGGPMSIVFVALIALYAGELVWRARDVRMNEVLATSPTTSGVAFAGNLLALAGMLVVLHAVLVVAGMLIQAYQGYYNFEPLLYIQILFGFTLADFLLFAVLAMTIHVIVDQKYIGHLVTILLYTVTVFAAQFGVRHNLLIYGSDPGWTYSDMNGFGPFIGPFIWFKLYWASWALLLGLVASLLWVHGREGGFRDRLAEARLRLSHGVMRLMSLAIALIMGTGGFIYYNTNVLNHYAVPGENEARLADYERLYKRYEAVAQPQVTANELRVEIYPESRAVDISAAYRLVNLTAAPIDSIHVILRRAMQARSVSLDRAARPVLQDSRHGYRIYVLDRPLQPGDSMRLRFDLSFKPKGFPNDGINTSVATNGAYFDRTWLPVIGYQPDFELTDEADRGKHGLTARTAMPSADDPAALHRRSPRLNEDLVAIDAIIGTAADQIVVTPGTLLRQWSENGRRYFHYRTETPIPTGAPFLSARYAVRQGSWRPGDITARPVDLKLYHHPTHTSNLDRLLASMKGSLDYYTSNFGPYQFSELRIVEFPRYASFARAHPHTIAFSEGGSFLTRVESWDVDRPFFVTAHEIAHQWWGHQASGASVKGAALLTETLAQYSSMMVLEKTYGTDHVRRLYDFAMDYYLSGRGGATKPEVPMLDVGDESYLYYQKGAVVMYMLRERIGEARVNAALKRYLEKYRFAASPFPTSRDLYRELRAETPDSLRGLLSDLFEKVTLWDVRTDSVSVAPAANGAHRVTLQVTASKAHFDSTGAEFPAEINDLVEIGVMAPDSAGVPGRPLYLREHRVRSGRQTISIIVPVKPARAGIDPFGKLIQRVRKDNMLTVSAEDDV